MKNKIEPTAVPLVEVDKHGAGKEYDFRAYFLGIPVFDMKLDDAGYAGMGDGPELIEKLKETAFSIVEHRIRIADQGERPTRYDEDTLVLVELIRQKFRQGVAENRVLPGETPRTYFRRNLEIRFLL